MSDNGPEMGLLTTPSTASTALVEELGGLPTTSFPKAFPKALTKEVGVGSKQLVPGVSTAKDKDMPMLSVPVPPASDPDGASQLSWSEMSKQEDAEGPLGAPNSIDEVSGITQNHVIHESS